MSQGIGPCFHLKGHYYDYGGVMWFKKVYQRLKLDVRQTKN